MTFCPKSRAHMRLPISQASPLQICKEACILDQGSHRGWNAWRRCRCAHNCEKSRGPLQKYSICNIVSSLRNAIVRTSGKICREYPAGKTSRTMTMKYGLKAMTTTDPHQGDRAFKSLPPVGSSRSMCIIERFLMPRMWSSCFLLIFHVPHVRVSPSPPSVVDTHFSLEFWPFPTQIRRFEPFYTRTDTERQTLRLCPDGEEQAQNRIWNSPNHENQLSRSLVWQVRATQISWPPALCFFPWNPKTLESNATIWASICSMNRRFVEEFMIPNKPVIITGLVEPWPAVRPQNH